MPIRITHTAESAEDLRHAARSTRDMAQARRLLAIALVMERRSRTEAATAAGMDRQSLRDRVHRFNSVEPATREPERRWSSSLGYRFDTSPEARSLRGFASG